MSFSTTQNVIILINLNKPQTAKAYTSLTKLCKMNNDFPLKELYRRDKYKFPFTKIIKGTPYLFVKTEINDIPEDILITNEILRDTGLAEIQSGKYRIEEFYIKQIQDGYHFYKKTKGKGIGFVSETIKYVNDLKRLFKSKTGIELNIIIN
jgi:hypothetical protein